MPNRILRDWTASDRIDQLSQGAEVFFTRVIMKADDFGLYYGNPKLLNSALFPLRDYENKQVSAWLSECIKAGIIRKYTVDGKDYIQIQGFDQRLRLMKSKFPAPPENAEFHEPSNDCQLSDERPLETKRNEDETETETNPAIADVCIWPTFEEFWDKYDKKKGKPKAEQIFKKINQVAREKIMLHLNHYIFVEKRYRKDPERYLKGECWNDEVILTPQTNGTGIDKRTSETINRREAFAKRNSASPDGQ